MADTTAAVPEPHPHDTRENILFGGVYGAVLACSMVAASPRIGAAPDIFSPPIPT